jgi:hypothetical protein
MVSPKSPHEASIRRAAVPPLLQGRLLRVRQAVELQSSSCISDVTSAPLVRCAPSSMRRATVSAVRCALRIALRIGGTGGHRKPSLDTVFFRRPGFRGRLCLWQKGGR